MTSRLVLAGAALLLCAGFARAEKAGTRLDTQAMAAAQSVTPTTSATTNEGDPVVDLPESTLGGESDLSSRTANLDSGKASEMMNKTFDAGAAEGFDKTFSGSNDEAKIVMPVSSLGGKSFAVPSFRLPENEEAADRFSKSSNLSARDSPFSSKAAHGFDRTVESKEYTGPEAEKIHREMSAINQNLGSLEDLPDRNLSMAEVKQLLNQYTTGESKQTPVMPAEPVTRKAIPVE